MLAAVILLGASAAVPASARATEGDGEPLVGVVMPRHLQDLKRSHKVRLIYFVPTDREPTANYEQKIIAFTTFVADVFRRDLTAKGYATGGLDFEFAKGRPVVHMVKGDHDAAYYSGAPRHDRLRQWQTVTSEVQGKLGHPERMVYLVFAETYDEGPAEVEWPGAHAQGMYLSADSGIAVVSSWMLRDELCATTVKGQLANLFDSTPVPGRTAMGYRHPNSPRFEFVEDAIGAVVHELGHTLGLPHDNRHALNLMGSGFRFLNRAFMASTPAEHLPRFSEDNARFLSRSRFIAEQFDATDVAAPKFSLSLVTRPKPGDQTVTYEIDATDDRGLGAILYYDQAADTVVGGQELSGTSVKLSVTLAQKPLLAGQQLAIQVKTIDRNGATSWATIQHTVEGPVLSTSGQSPQAPSARP